MLLMNEKKSGSLIFMSLDKCNKKPKCLTFSFVLRICLKPNVCKDQTCDL